MLIRNSSLPVFEEWLSEVASNLEINADLVVYSVDLNGYDFFNFGDYQGSSDQKTDWDLVYFTDKIDNDALYTGIHQVLVPPSIVHLFSCTRLCARAIKAVFGSYLEVQSIYCDASSVWKKSPVELLRYAESCDRYADLAFFSLKKSNKTQLNEILDSGYRVDRPENFFSALALAGTTSIVFSQVAPTGLMIFLNPNNCKDFSNFWIRLTLMITSRDQVTLPWAIFYSKTRIKILDSRIFSNDWIEFKGHRNTFILCKVQKASFLILGQLFIFLLQFFSFTFVLLRKVFLR